MTDELLHGSAGSDEWSHARWCAVHGWHGIHHRCPEYGAGTLAEIAEQDARLRASLADGSAEQELISSGCTPEVAATVVAVFKALGGQP